MNPVIAIVAAGAIALATPALAEDKLVAIDVLLLPDERMLAAAEEWNKRLRQQLPNGFSLDDTHRPHITLLQQYVAEKDLDAVVTAVKSLAASEDLKAMKLTAIGLYHIPSGKIGLQGITIKPSDDILALQAKVIQTLEPFRKSGGDEAAFVSDPTGTPFDPFLFTYVDTFVEKQAGKNFSPHVTTGTGPLEWVEAREGEPFEQFEFGVDKLTVYKLGNFGTAAEPLGE
jgi:2'-5' RNA ligase